MSNQRSILSFFGSSSSTELPKPSSQQLPQLQPKPAFGQQSTSQQRSHPPPPPPPPPSSARFVPPPSARNGTSTATANGTANDNGSTPHPGMTVAASAMRWGGTTEPNVNLAPITPAYGRSILQAAGAAEDAEGNIVFSPSSASNKNKIVFPRDIHMPDLVSINGILLPVRYSDSFYKHVTNTTRVASLFNRVILGDDGEVVGGIVCRLEPSPFTSDSSGSSSATSTPSLAVYVQSLALLSPYRGRGLMAAAFESIVATVQALNAAAATPTGPLAATGPVTALFAHVWTEHDDAMAWYIARKFVRQGDAPIEDYYFALRPATAWVVRRDVPAGVPASVSQRVLEATKAAKESAAAAPPPPLPLSSSSQNSQKLVPPPNVRSQSYQNSRPETEWNDLPADMMAATSASASLASSRNPSRKVSQANLTGDATAAAATGTENGNGDSPPSLLAPPTANGSQASSRSSSSTGKKKRERAYPAAMFQ